MTGPQASLKTEGVEVIETPYRRIHTPIPVPESRELLERLRALEPRSMGGQPPVVWQGGDGVTVHDPYGNRWLDFSSGVLVTASGHGHPAIVNAIRDIAGQGLYHAYGFPTDIRRAVLEELTAWLPAPLGRVFLLTTGAEAVECCLKLARTLGNRRGGPDKNVIVSFHHAFHGRTMGAQLAGGIPGLKSWLGGTGADAFVQVPYPDGFREPDTGFGVFERALEAQGVAGERVCGVISETYQGCNAALIPPDYARALRAWCDRTGALLILDEVQAGFGRTGAPFGFSHLGIVPDLVACGKGISGGMPMSAVLGRDEPMDLYGPGEMTSTHSANPVCCAAALANLQTIRREGLIENAARLAPVLREGLERIQRAADGQIGRIDAIGLVGALQFTKPGTTEPCPAPARELVRRCVAQGLLLFAPVGVGGAAIKINPPLLIPEDALREGLEVMERAARDLPATDAQS
ncbi:MAG: aspartate aminotransferase family protein [Phycisphaerales bacterium]|nr:aspartate aminotransferase family protein [Phycisphaerales bacterium]